VAARTIVRVTKVTYTSGASDLTAARPWPFESSPLAEFNLRSLGMTGPYGAAVCLTAAAITAGVVVVDHPTVHEQTPAANVRLTTPGTTTPMRLPPVEAIKHNIPLASGAPNDVPLTGVTLDLGDPARPTFTFKK
jgi:hypothetical protein